jgi:hypothetical protein
MSMSLAKFPKRFMSKVLILGPSIVKGGRA